MKPKLLNYLITLIVVGLAAGSLYLRYLQTPWTRDGQVRANVVGIAPRVSGPIIRVAVRDNQPVRQGDPRAAIALFMLLEDFPNTLQQGCIGPASASRPFARLRAAATGKNRCG